MKPSRAAREPENLELAVAIGDRQIRFRSAVLEHLRSGVIEGYRAVKHGGVEVGGVLFGIDREGSVEVHAYRELVCEHLFGPSFRLSAGDEEHLAALIDSPAHQEGLSTFTAVGWYCSHSRSELAVLERDVSLHERHFPAASSFLLLLKPASTFTVEGVVFPSPLTASRPEFNSTPQILLEPRYELQTAEPKSAAEPAPVPPAPQPVEAPPRRRAYPSPWILGTGIMCLLLAGIFAAQRILSLRGDSGLQLQLNPAGSQLLIRWDDPLSWRRGARTAWIEIHDGDNTTRTPVAGDFPEHGVLFYSQRNTRVSVRMRVNGPDARSEEKLASADGLTPAPVPVQPAPVSDPSADSLHKQLEVLRKRNRLLEATIGQLRHRQVRKRK